jgi:hypothetical protein
VGYEKDREPKLLLQLSDLGKDVSLKDDIQSRRRLVHDDHLWAQHERHGDHHTLAHAPR